MASSMTLKWCKKNMELYSQSVYDMLKDEYPDLEMEIADCVDLCGLCTDVPFVLRNNAVVGARDARGLYVKLKQGMEFLSGEPIPGTYAAVVSAAKANDKAAESDTDK